MPEVAQDKTLIRRKHILHQFLPRLLTYYFNFVKFIK